MIQSTRRNRSVTTDDEKKRAEKTRDDSIQAELAELRAQLQAIQENSTRRIPEEIEEETKTSAASQLKTEETPASDLSSQLQELIAGFDRELKEAKPMTLLAVFALGVVVGRVLSK
jgi:hypothetical protein